MNKRVLFVAAWVLLVLGMTTQAYAEAECKICGGWGHASAYGRLFNSDTVQSLEGEVLSVNKIAPMDTEDYGISYVLDTGDEEIFVHLGPSWFVESEPLQVETGDRIIVTGSKVSVEDEDVIIVTEIKKGSDVMSLRSPEGQPAWSGWKRGTN